MKLKFTLLLGMIILLGMNVFSQERITISSPAYLNEPILGDTLSDGTHPERIYVLERGGTYYVRGVLENLNFKLHLVAADGDGPMPIVRADLQEDGTQSWIMFAGQKDVEMEGIFLDAQSENEGYNPANWCLAYFGKDANLTFNNCVFANTGQGGVGAWNAVNEFTVTNCKFYNMGNIEFSDQGAGRMVECRDSEVKKLTVTNNTVVNSYDRMVRHRNGAGVIHEMVFSHNTIINNGGYFGVMELGNVGKSVEITDNLFIDAMSFGADQSDAQRRTEFNMHGETDGSGNEKIVWIGSVPNDSTAYSIKNNIYSVSSELAAFYTSKGVDGGPILTDHITSKLSSPEKAFIKKDVSVAEAPAAMIDLLDWYYETRIKGVTPDADYNRMTIDYMLNTLNCAYTVSDFDFLGTDGVPVGDPYWGSSAVSRVTIASPAYLNEPILGDTLTDGTHPARTYVLERGGTYYVRGVLENLNFKLHLVAEDGDGPMPIVRADLQEDGTQSWIMFAGQKDVEMEGIFLDAQSENEGYNPANWCLAYFGKDANLTFNNCVFANTGQGGVGAWNAVNEFTVTNCKFYNMGNIEFSDQGAGRMVECRDSEVKKLTVTNNTVVNSYDRMVRHRNGAGVIHEMVFSHNTIINNGGYFGVMELGNVGKSVEITDNLFIDAMSFGADQSDAQRRTEFNMHGETDGSGNEKIVWIGSVPNDSTAYSIKNNIYSVSSELAAFYTSKGVDGGPILTDHITSKLSDPEKAFIKKDVSVIEAPAAMIDLLEWYYTTRIKGVTPDADYNRMTIDYMLNTLDCQYNVSDAEFIGTDGTPVGDPYWDPSVVTAVNEIRTTGLELTTYPNPFTSFTTVQFNLDTYASVNIRIYDITGKAVKQFNAGTFAPGVNNLKIQKDNMVSGIYILRLDAETQFGMQKIVVK
ncbi:right-handed parallel beta-helix repeat-containing protein [uncultured Draconibacterium sp.]|uniref:T9SS type A sorting domain-containing protein n=1 Tax=uncultured Draconibacterium sp. TaxID=1573823 RepID=UPI003216CD08